MGILVDDLGPADCALSLASEISEERGQNRALALRSVALADAHRQALPTLAQLGPDGAGSASRGSDRLRVTERSGVHPREVVETRQGVCRLGSGLARELGCHSDALREAVGPHAERLARELLAAPDHPTPLTRRRRRGCERRLPSAPRLRTVRAPVAIFAAAPRCACLTTLVRVRVMLGSQRRLGLPPREVSTCRSAAFAGG